MRKGCEILILKVEIDLIFSQSSSEESHLPSSLLCLVLVHLATANLQHATHLIRIKLFFGLVEWDKGFDAIYESQTVLLIYQAQIDSREDVGRRDKGRI